VTAAVKAVVAAGVEVRRIKIANDGSIEIDTINGPDAPDAGSTRDNQWDGALK
jgi:hypothetical protein